MTPNFLAVVKIIYVRIFRPLAAIRTIGTRTRGDLNTHKLIYVPLFMITCGFSSKKNNTHMTLDP